MTNDQMFNAQFKAKIALEALRGESTYEEIAENYDIDPGKVEEWADYLKGAAEPIFIEEHDEVNTDLNTPESNPSEKLRHAVSLLRATLDASNNGILVIDREGRIVSYNRRFLGMWNIPEKIMAEGKDEKAIEHVLKQLENPKAFRERINELYDNPGATSQDIIRFKDGRIFERTSIPQKIGDRIVGRVWSFSDITAHKNARKKLKRFGKLLESINANVEDGILRSTPEEGLIYVNGAFVEMFGYASKEEAMNTNPEYFYADPERRWELVDLLYNKGRYKNKEVQFRRKDGSTFWGLESSTLVEGENKKYIDAVVNDITERKKVENELRLSEEKYRTILENIEDGYFETNLRGEFTFFNESLRKTLGYPADELIGLNSREFMDEENAEKVYWAFNRVYRTGRPEKGFEWEVLDKNGERRIVESSVTLKYDTNENPVGFRGIVRDITQRKEHEKQIKASLKEKEVLLGEIHHRVKNNLAVISGLLYLQAEQAEDSNATELLKESQSRINSMALIHEMLYDNQTFSRVNPQSYIQELVDRIAQNMTSDQKDISIDVQTGDMLIDMNIAIPCALIINELMTNAFKYAFEGRDGGRISIQFRQDKDNKNYLLRVSDDGIGMPEGGNEEKGLGLFLVEELVRQIKGELTIGRNGGTTFEIRFPGEVE